MTKNDSSSSVSCRDIRQLLGVYVVGAIDPAERSAVDDHLTGCQSCRDELAGLAGLPAMLGRVPAEDVERLSLEPGLLADDPPPAGDLLNSLLRQVSLRRRSRLWRGAITVAAAAAVAAAGATAAVELARPAAQAGHTGVASAANGRTHVAAVVDYTTTPWGSTAMRVRVNGIPWGSKCQFWVIGANGQKSYAGAWTVLRSYGSEGWYTAASRAAPSSVHGFEITTGTKVLVTIPVS
jgi:anti-sigma factor RsiW